jgi:Tfp pilus assembly protein PilO
MTESINHWHLDKRVPIGIIFALVLQSGAVFWWAGQMEQRMTAVEAQLTAQRELTQQGINAQNTTNERLARIETLLEILARQDQLEREQDSE